MLVHTEEGLLSQIIRPVRVADQVQKVAMNRGTVTLGYLGGVGAPIGDVLLGGLHGASSRDFAALDGRVRRKPRP